MKHTSLIICLLLSIFHASQPMNQIIKASEPSAATQMLIQGINRKDLQQVRDGISAGADVNHDASLLYLAASTSTEEIMIELLNHKDINVYSDLTPNERTPLHMACLKNFPTAAQLIIQKDPASVHIRDKTGAQPPHMAAARRNIQCIDTLISHGNIDINCQDYDGDTALHLACSSSSPDNHSFIKQLIDRGAYTTIKNNDQKTPIFVAFPFWPTD